MEPFLLAFWLLIFIISQTGTIIGLIALHRQINDLQREMRAYFGDLLGVYEPLDVESTDAQNGPMP